jgi:hypothetical protein
MLSVTAPMTAMTAATMQAMKKMRMLNSSMNGIASDYIASEPAEIIDS